LVKLIDIQGKVQYLPAQKHKMKTLALILVLLPLISLSQEKSVEELKRQFLNPDNSYRGKPFWSWNGELEKEELIRQVHIMKEMGMGGFFMHSRTGLKTEYLGDKWFDLINACADEAEKLGMEAWLYDEDRWPSGLAGGLVTKYPEYRTKHLTLHTYSPGEFEPLEDYIVLFSCRLDGVDCFDYKKIEEKDISGLSPEKTVLAFCIREKASSPFFNGFTDVDRMSREATDYFIKITHDEYQKRCGSRLGKSIKGIFTDEPNRSSALSSFGQGNGTDKRNRIFVPWTGKFAEEFNDRVGYDIIDRLPEIFYRPDGNAVSQVKWHYMEVAQQLFLENWVVPYYDWCEKNNIIFTGHFLHEDNLTSQTAMQGSLMRAYEYMHYPGIDILSENNRNYWVAKQVQSVARQMGQKFILSELYGVTGWQFDFADHKYVGDWQTLFGVNLRCHHLSWYTMQGEAKRDYPASILHQSGWYTDYDYVEDYFSRMGYLISQGEPVCDVLVMSPVESVWSQIRIGWSNGLSPADAEVVSLEEHYKTMFNALQGNQIDFDYADEDIFKRHSSVIVENGEAILKVGLARYKAVVLGKMTTIRSSSLDILNEFVDAGGKVIIAGEEPKYVDALQSDKAIKLGDKSDVVSFNAVAISNAVQNATSVMCEAIDQNTGRRIDDIFCQLRQDGDRKIFMALNKSREKSFDNVLLKIKADGKVTEWDCESGELVSIPSKEAGGYLKFETSFAKAEEHIYTVTNSNIKGSVTRPELKFKKEISLAGPYSYKLDEPNVCLLDMGYVEIEGQQKTGMKEILKADQYIRDHFGIPHRGGKMVQPWFKAKFADTPKPLGKVKISFPFYVEEMPVSGLKLCLETPNEFEISINGQKMELKDKGWWIDKSLRLVELPAGILKPGLNTLVQEFEFRDDLNLEALYLLGDFAVRLERSKKSIYSLPEKISVGCLTKQGFPFYSGRITYKVSAEVPLSKDETAILEVPEYEAACIKLDANSENEKMIAWYPNKADATSSINENRELALEVVLTRRNIFGPFHNTPFEGRTGPMHFVTTGKSFTMDYMLNPSGILKKPVLRIFY
jgi:hypothetical protein